MFDEKDFEAAKQTLLKINEAVIQIDPAVRVSAFEILVARYMGERGAYNAKKVNAYAPAAHAETPDTNDLGAFISSFDASKPADAVMVLVAWLYSSYGVYPVSAKEIKELANACGLTVPARPDNTMRAAKHNGKGLFNQQAKGWQLTVSGELYVKETFKIKKGSKALPTA